MHIAIIMDGNGRWAKIQGKRRIYGHQNAVSAVRDVTEAAAELGIRYLTLFAFSTENWSRPQEEVNALMALLVTTLNRERETFVKNNVRLLAIGDLKELPGTLEQQLRETTDLTRGHTGLSLVLALSYSARWEILNAVKNIAAHISDSTIRIDDIDSRLFSRYLTTKDIPDPDLLIRTSGEYRISNFLLWQIAYSELYFTGKLWPDFRREVLYEAIINYQYRERRFGKISEQVV